MECLAKVQNRQADFLAADPEDMYVAFNLKNEDFSIFSELRTVSGPSFSIISNEAMKLFQKFSLIERRVRSGVSLRRHHFNEKK